MYKKNRHTTSSRGGDGLFGWTIFILLLVGLAVASWMGSFFIFGHPENGFSYNLLRKLGKLDPPKRFELTAAPRGQFLDANALYERYGTMPPLRLEAESQQLLRSYLRNYYQSKELVPYVIGSYTIMGVFRLGPNNFFNCGVVALAHSTENPNVLLELIFPAEEKNVANLERLLLTGLDLKLAKTLDLTAVINARFIKDGRLSITAVPLLYGSYTSSDATGAFSLEPPQDLHVAAGLPVLNQAAVDKAAANYKNHLQRAGLDTSPATMLMRVQTPEPVHPNAIPIARAEAAPPREAPTPTPPTIDAPTMDGMPVARAEAVVPHEEAPPQPAPTPTPTPVAVAAATPATNATIATTTASAWSVYEPGRMPRGKLVSLDDARAMANSSSEGITYLSGDFQVSASGENASGQKRAVLRGQRGQKNIRVIVDFPTGSTPLTEGQSINRDEQRPFQITSVEKGDDGQINVYVREVTRP